SYDHPLWSDPDFREQVAREALPYIREHVNRTYRLRNLQDRIAKWFSDPKFFDPTIDEVAINRALDGDVAAYDSLTQLENRSALRAIVRVGWWVWRYGVVLTRAEKDALGVTETHGSQVDPARDARTQSLARARDLRKRVGDVLELTR